MIPQGADAAPPAQEKAKDSLKIESGTPSVSEGPVTNASTLQRWMTRLDNIPGLEARGIERVSEELRHPKVTVGSYLQMFLIWFAINCTANNMTVGILGPVAYGLGFHDAIV
jgi:hypothetical protein